LGERGRETYHAVGENDTDFLDGSSELVLGHAALVLNVEKFESLREESALFLRGRALLREFSLQVLLETAHYDTLL
jgi:hypothetical protein